MTTHLTLSNLPAPLPPSEGLSASTLTLKLHGTLPPPPASPSPSAPAAGTASLAPHPPQTQTLTVIASTPKGELTLQTPGGQTLTATTAQLPPPPPGTRLSIPLPPPTPQTAQPAQPAVPGQPPAPAATPPQTQQPPVLTVTARMLPAAAPTPTVQNTPTPQQAPSPPLSTAKPPLPTAYFPSQNSTFAIQTALNAQMLPNPQASLPLGPLSFSISNLPPETLARPSILTITTPTGGTLTPQTAAAPVSPYPVQFTSPTQLPPGQRLPVTVLPNPVNGNLPLVTLRQAVPMPPSGTPFTPPALSAMRVLLNPGQRVPVPTATPLAARVLPQPPAQLAENGTTLVRQPILLASGHRAMLQSPQPLPAESTLVVEFPTVSAPAQVLRTQPAGQPAMQQPQTQTAGAQLPPNPAAPASLPAPPGTTVQGTLTGQNQQGQTLLTINAPPQYTGQQVALNLPPALQAQLPLGTALTATVESPGLAMLVALNLAPSAQRAHTLTHFSQGWAGLTQALNLLNTHAPAQANALRARLPQLSALLPGLMSFADAIRAGNIESFTGAETASLLRGMGLTFASDVQHLAQLAQPQPDTPWRGLMFPYVENPQDDPRQGGFFWRREKKDDPRAATSTRFIVQLSMSQIGDIQLDGLVTYPDIWLKLRRTTPPEPGFVEGLQTMVNALLESHGLNGAIAVETTAAFPVDPLAELLAAGPTPLPTSA